jgi:hypothetical protein
MAAKKSHRFFTDGFLVTKKILIDKNNRDKLLNQLQLIYNIGSTT